MKKTNDQDGNKTMTKGGNSGGKELLLGRNRIKEIIFRWEVIKNIFIPSAIKN